jgi:hypothetical protein
MKDAYLTLSPKPPMIMAGGVMRCGWTGPLRGPAARRPATTDPAHALRPDGTAGKIISGLRPSAMKASFTTRPWR